MKKQMNAMMTEKEDKVVRKAMLDG